MSAERISADRLRAFSAACLERLGMTEEGAARVADTLVQADLWGHQSHGVMRLFWYGARLQNGATTPQPSLRVEIDAGALALLDGDDGMGQLAAHAAMREAVTRAKRHGVGAVSVRRGGHFGTAMYFTRQAAAAGCIGLLCTNASPAMPPWGGREKRVGTNPWSIGAPAGAHPPMLLDIANTAVARGKLYLARQRGERIPLGWAMDAGGAPTDDPAAGIAGAILPMAGHKGYGIALMMDVLAGVLPGNAFGAGVTGPYVPEGRSGAGCFALAIDIAKIRPLAEFEADMGRLIAELKATPRADDVSEIFYPGEPEARSEAAALETGLAIPPDTLAELREKGAALGVTL